MLTEIESIEPIVVLDLTRIESYLLACLYNICNHTMQSHYANHTLRIYPHQQDCNAIYRHMFYLLERAPY